MNFQKTFHESSQETPRTKNRVKLKPLHLMEQQLKSERISPARKALSPVSKILNTDTSERIKVPLSLRNSLNGGSKFVVDNNI